MNFNKLPDNSSFKRGKFIRPGIQILTLKDLFLQTSQNTGNQRPVFSMETDPITDEGWEGHEGAKGQIGNIAGNFNYYLKNDNQKDEFVANLRDIMVCVGTFDKFMETHGEKDFENLADVVESVKPFIIGSRARYFVAGEQYHKLNNSGVGLKLKFPSKRMVESIKSDSKFPNFDENNPNHFKKVDKREASEGALSTGKTDGLPF